MKSILLFLFLTIITPFRFDTLLYQNSKGEIIEHKSYIISYDQHLKTTRWASYMLTDSMVRTQVIKRTNNFKKDPLAYNSPSSSDYDDSGYDQGHLVNAQDMRFDVQSEHESFYMTNMIPQKPSLNRGIWKELEIKCRNWALERDTIIIICGPMFLTQNITTIGRNIPVPSHCFKIIYDPETKESVSFVFPNGNKYTELNDYLSSINGIEKYTDIDFLSTLEDCEEEEIESLVNDCWLLN